MLCLLSILITDIVLIAPIGYSSVLVNLIVTPVELRGVVPCAASFIHGKGHHKGTEKNHQQRDFTVWICGYYCPPDVTFSALKLSPSM